MIRMGMGIDNRIKLAPAEIDHLRTEVRPGINDNSRDTAVVRNTLHQHGSTPSFVLWIGRIAIAPVAIEARHARRRTAAKNGKAQAIRHQRPLALAFW
jgi:hypothetical protein